jgi:hypothetical protein
MPYTLHYFLPGARACLPPGVSTLVPLFHPPTHPSGARACLPPGVRTAAKHRCEFSGDMRVVDDLEQLLCDALQVHSLALLLARPQDALWASSARTIRFYPIVGRRAAPGRRQYVRTLWAKSSQFACATARSFGSAAALRKPEATSSHRGQTRPGASRKRMATGATYVPAAAASSSLSSLSACHGMLCRPKRLAGTR